MARPLTLVDLPGHEKQRFHFSDYASIAGGVVFVVDSATLARNYRKVADFLYDVLSHAKVTEHRNPVLLVLNKSDAAGALRTAAARQLLEEELYGGGD